MPTETLQLERLVDDPEIRRAAAKTLKGFCLTYLPHHFPADLSEFFDEMAGALQDHNERRLEIIGFRGCAKSTMASLPDSEQDRLLVLAAKAGWSRTVLRGQAAGVRAGVTTD